MAGTMNSHEAAKMYHFDVTSSEGKSLFSSFSTLPLLKEIVGKSAFLQRSFNPSEFVVTLLADFRPESPGMTCLMQWKYEGDYWSEMNKMLNDRYEELQVWIDNNIPDMAIQEQYGNNLESGARTYGITFPGDWQNDNRSVEAFQAFVEKVCTHLASL